MIPIVYGGNRAAFVLACWKKPVLKRTLVGWQNRIVAAAIAGRFIIEPRS